MRYKLPLYRQVANQIQDKIKINQFNAGDPIPTEAELSKHFNVSRITVRRALKLLIEQGVLESIQGSGTYVKEIKINYNIYQLTGFYDKLNDLQYRNYSKVLQFEVITPPDFIQKTLQLNENEHVYFVKRIRYLEDKPVIVEETWMPLHLFTDLRFEVMEHSKYQYIEKEKQMRIDYSEQEIVPILPSSEIATLLEIEQNQPILEKITKGFLSDGTVFEYSRNYFNTNEYRFTLIAKREITATSEE